MTNSGMKAVDSFKYMADCCGGEELVGHIYKNHVNFVYKIKMSEIEGGDVQNVLDILVERLLNDGGFFYKVRIGDDGSLCSIFLEGFNDGRRL